MVEKQSSEPNLLTRTAFYDGQRMTLHGVVLEVIEVQPTRIVLAANNDPVIVERFAEREARWHKMDEELHASTAKIVGRMVANMRTGKPAQEASDKPDNSESSDSEGACTPGSSA